MKNLATVLSCISMAVFGLALGITGPSSKSNTVSAAEPNYYAPHVIPTITKHDTIEVKTPGDTVRVEKIVKQTKYHTKRVVDTVRVEIPILYTRTRGIRKEFSPDSLLSPRNKRVTREVIELCDKSETRLYSARDICKNSRSVYMTGSHLPQYATKQYLSR